MKFKRKNKRSMKTSSAQRTDNGRRWEGTNRRYSYQEFLTLIPCCSESHRVELLETLKEAKCPGFINDIEVPKNLSTISYGKLVDLREAAESNDPPAQCMKIILGISILDVYKLNVVDVFGFLNFCTKEIEKINKLFASIKVKYTSEELSAGVKDLDFGPFGVMDWYARRMGITNQNEVRDVAWIRIYNCMKNDAEQNNYERRLRDQYKIRKR